MTKQKDWAEGSGSTWEDLDGDPRIQPGAEVLVGSHGQGLVSGMRPYLGARARVVDRPAGDRWCVLDCHPDYKWAWRVRDLVCLRMADGELTREGDVVRVWALDADGGRKYWSPIQGDPVRRAWGERAGIFTRTTVANQEVLEIDRRRLDMALGREPEPVKAEPAESYFVTDPDRSAAPVTSFKQIFRQYLQTFDRELTAAEVDRVYCNSLAGHSSCPTCLAPTSKPEPCAACAPQPATDPFPPRARVRLVGKGDDYDGDDEDTRWQHIGERASIADADVVASVRLSPGWRLTRTDGGEWVAWPCSGMRRLDQEPVESVMLPDTQPERRCMLCRHAKVSMDEAPCAGCEDHSAWLEPVPTCGKCGRPLDVLSQNDRSHGSAVTYCGDCGFEQAKRRDRADAAATKWPCFPSDRSGEAHLSSLRAWLDPVCGREHWRCS